MYHPYFRGKQFELITVRECARLLSDAGFVPIIEPVREALGGLQRTLGAVSDVGGKAVVVVNPYHGDHREDGISISDLLRESYSGDDSIVAGILLKEDMTLQEVLRCYEEHMALSPMFIHAGFCEPRSLAEALTDELATTNHVFFERYCGKLYRKHFADCKRVLLRDGFERRRNADHPPIEPFSDLHATFADEGMDGFGDFLVVGDDYIEGGGPAYAVAIHLTFIDPDRDDAMFIYHFVSETKDTPTDPAGKFAEALRDLMHKLSSGTSKLLETSAVREFRKLHAMGHFPGLGYVKKLSMKHHIETLADHFS